jgi:hypothetical protein
MYAVKIDGNWELETVDAIGSVGRPTALALDRQGNPGISYYDNTNSDLKFAGASVRLLSPVGGEVWQRGAQATVTWDGTGVIDIFLSTDGGLNYSPLVLGVSGGSVSVDVPGSSTDEARVKIVRNDHFSTSSSPGIFAIAPERVSPWWLTGVDTVGDVGMFSSIAVSPAGNPHVAYYDVTNGDLKYTVKNGTSWLMQTVDAAGDVGWFASLELDAQGAPHIGYYDNVNLDLKYAVRTGGSWTLETVDAAGDVGWFASLVVDALDVPHVSYFDGTNDDLKYAARTGGSWSVETIDGAADAGDYASLALDVSGTPHISYFDDGNGDLKYAVKTAGSWSIETVDATGDVGLWTLVTSTIPTMISSTR